MLDIDCNPTNTPMDPNGILMSDQGGLFYILVDIKDSLND
jgi:hypothetical protein